MGALSEFRRFLHICAVRSLRPADKLRLFLITCKTWTSSIHLERYPVPTHAPKVNLAQPYPSPFCAA